MNIAARLEKHHSLVGRLRLGQRAVSTTQIITKQSTLLLFSFRYMTEKKNKRNKFRKNSCSARSLFSNYGIFTLNTALHPCLCNYLRVETSIILYPHRSHNLFDTFF